MIKRYNITTCKIYQQNGEEKKTWPQVGTMVYFPASNGNPEGYRIELNMFPGTRFFTFEQKPQNGPRTNADPEPVIDADTGAMRMPSKQATGNAKGVTPAVIPPGGIRQTDDQINYPMDEINPDDIPF
jgi:hypothetical protein